jgi:hypothetical protein
MFLLFFLSLLVDLFLPHIYYFTFHLQSVTAPATFSLLSSLLLQVYYPHDYAFGI